MGNEQQDQRRTNVREYEGTISNAECEVRNADLRPLTTDHGPPPGAEPPLGRSLTTDHSPPTTDECGIHQNVECGIMLGAESREPSGAEPLRGGAREPRAASAPLRGAERGRREAGRRGREPFERQGLVLWCGFDREAGVR